MNNFSKLSDGDGTIFLLRWRGRQEGPYTGPVIEAKLAANEIGLLHEIYYEGKWITLRDYIAVRANILRAESQAREEQEQKLKQEAERKAAVREAMLRAEPPPAEKPKIPPAEPPPAEPVRRRQYPRTGTAAGTGGFWRFAGIEAVGPAAVARRFGPRRVFLFRIRSFGGGRRRPRQ